MGAILYRFRYELGTRWRAWLGLALLLGVASGAVLTLAAGARRTDSAYARFLRAQRAYDVMLVNFPDDVTAILDFDEVAQLPQVADSARGSFFYVDLGPGVAAIAGHDNRIGTTVNRLDILDGRAPDPGRIDEVAVPFAIAESQHLHVGSRFSLFSPKSLASLEAGGNASPEQLATLHELLQALPGGKFTVVGIEASPGEFPPQLSPGGAPMHMTPAYDRRFGALQGNEVLLVRLRHGSRDVASFHRELVRRAGGRPLQITIQQEQAADVRRSLHLQAVALWLLAGLVAVATALVAAQLLARNAVLEGGDHPTLAALGMSRTQRFVLGLARAGAIGTIAALGAVGVAIAASPLLPAGLARRAEPDSGVHVDAVVLALGAVTILVLLVALAALPTWRAARQASATARADGLRARRSWAAALLEGSALRPAPLVGVRMAVDPGRGRSATPVRSTFAAVSLGLATLIAALTFGASLSHLLDSPTLYGVTWTVELTNYGTGPDLRTPGVAALTSFRGVEAVAAADFGGPFEVNGVRADILGLDGLVRSAHPPVVAGRAPRRADEVALGAKTMRDAGVEIGDSALLRFVEGGQPVRMRVVGRVVIPPLGDAAQLGKGMWTTSAGVRRLLAGLDPTFRAKAIAGQGLFVRLSPGTSATSVAAALDAQVADACRRDAGLAGCDQVNTGVALLPPSTPTDIVNFGRVESMPLVLGSVLAAVAAGTLVHVLVTAVRRRRRDLAILKTIGFDRRQVRRAVAWQATTVVLVGLAAGVPLGIAAGRWVWGRLAGDLGVLDQPRVPWLAIVVTVGAALFLANLVATLPARAAARTRPAVVLRSE